MTNIKEVYLTCPECRKTILFDDELERHLINRHSWKPIRASETTRKLEQLAAAQ